MDIPLTSDALDIAFHPDPATHVIAAGLLTGKIQLIDYSAHVQRSSNHGRSSSSTSSTNSAGSSSGSAGQGASISSSFKKTLSLRPSIKSTRALAFDNTGDTLWAASKDRSLFAIDPATGTLRSHWAATHAAPPSRMITLPSGLLVTGDDDGAVKLWDPRTPTTSAPEPAAKKLKLGAGSSASSASAAASNAVSPTTATPVRAYAHHFDWISDMLWCEHLAPPKTPVPPKDAKGKAKAKALEQQQHQQQQSEGALRSRLVCTSGDGSLSVIDFRQGGSVKEGKKTAKGVEVSEDQEDELLAVASVKGGSKFVVGTQLGILSVWAPTRAMLDHVDRIPGHPASVDTICSVHDASHASSSSSSSSSSRAEDIVNQFAQDDDVLLTGSSDGLIRILQIGPPHKLLGVLADHGGNGMPVERIRRKGRWVASIGHESAIKWSDLADLLDGDSEDEDDGDLPTASSQGQRTRAPAADDSDEGEEEDDDDDDDGDSDPEGDDAPEGPRRIATPKNADFDDDSDSDSDSDAPPPTTKRPSHKDKAALLAKGIAKGTLLPTTGAGSGDWGGDEDGDEDDGGRRGKKGGVKKKIRGHNKAMAKRAERAAFFNDM